jgi:signal peptidase I
MTGTLKVPRPRVRGDHILRDILGTLAFCVAVFTLLRLVVPGSVVQGSSMQPSFADGHRILINRLDYLFGQPQRGDIIIFNSPRPLRANEPPLIKRVIALPGERVEIIDTGIYVNGAQIEEPYINERCLPSQCRDNVWELGPDEYFVLGDNRNHSNDSRSFGPVNRKNIIGEALFRFWPPRSFGIVQRYHFPTE